MSKTTQILCCFSGVGKTYLINNPGNVSVVHLDTDEFTYNTVNGTNIENPKFPSNYIDTIKSYMGAVDYILVDSMDDVRSALRDNDIKYTLIYPKGQCRHEYIKRLIDNGTTKMWVQWVDNNWENLILKHEGDSFAHNKIILKPGQCLSHAVDYIEEMKKVNIVRSPELKYAWLPFKQQLLNIFVGKNSDIQGEHASCFAIDEARDCDADIIAHTIQSVGDSSIVYKLVSAKHIDSNEKPKMFMPILYDPGSVDSETMKEIEKALSKNKMGIVPVDTLAEKAFGIKSIESAIFISEEKQTKAKDIEKSIKLPKIKITNPDGSELEFEGNFSVNFEDGEIKVNVRPYKPCDNINVTMYVKGDKDEN